MSAPPVVPVRWRYHFTDLRLGVLLATLPMGDVSLSDVLGGSSDGSGTIPLASASVRARDPFAATVPRRTGCWAERLTLDPGSGAVTESTVPWAGIVMKRSRKGRALKLGMLTFPAYFARRLVPTRSWVQADKFTIMRTLFSDGSEQPLVDTADPGIYGNSPHMAPLHVGPYTPPQPLSGVLADRTYLDSDLKPVLDAARELGNSGDGFDWRMTPYMETPGDLTTFRVRLDLGYPRLGRVAPPDLRWSTDRGDMRSRWGFVAEEPEVVEDGSAVNNRITAVGSGTGSDQIRATADSIQTTRNEMRAGYLLYEASLNSSTSEDRTYDTVYGKAYGALLAGFAGEFALSAIKVRGDLAPVLSSYAVGDDATVKVGETTTGRTETFIGQITGRKIDPAEPGRTESVTFDVQGARSA